ncbi:nitrous oxide reductase accessory protein NosL [Pseudomonadota bacterium]
MHRRPIATALFALITFALVSGCSENADDSATSEPVNLTREAFCLLDGMILLDHPGPKGQVVLKNGERHYFCDTKGLFSVLHDPNYKNKIDQAFVQDFGKRKWDSYKDRWIEANLAFFVMDSRRIGAMGPTLASFGGRTDAEAFANEFGGVVLTYAEFDRDKFESYQKRISQQFRDGSGGTSFAEEEDEHQHKHH